MAVTTGYNEEEVIATLEKVKGCYDKVISLLIGDMQASFVSPLSDAWFSENAQIFMTSFKEAIEKEAIKVVNCYTNVLESINSAGVVWANASGADFMVMDIPYPGNLKLDVSNVRITDANGNRGADKSVVEGLVEKLTILIEDISSALDSTKVAVSQSGFIGGGQQESLNGSIDTIKSSLKLTINSLGSLTSIRVRETIERYGEIEIEATKAFAGE